MKEKMKFELKRLSEYTDASILAELKRVAALVPPELKLTKAQFKKYARVSLSAVTRRFGSWYTALQAAGLGSRYSGRTVSPKMKTQAAKSMTDKELVEELERVACELETETLTQAQFNSNSNIGASAISRRIGSWNKALRAAGLCPVTMGRRYSEDEYFENLLTVWTHLGRQPNYGEMNMLPSAITAGAYEKRWGSWTKALNAFVERVDSDGRDEHAERATVHPTNCVPRVMGRPEYRRKVPLGLRYNVLRRDRFKCVLCGNSPATDPRCKLHVDHILPLSEKGKTVEENLRTLCGDCNIGKSDKIETTGQ